ncbi:MAG: flagellar hook-basal body complex protein FliE [Clostridia bacterium]|nr:flagellar hook-basal body complex protein FliE [Clostridia bacterium]
MKISNVNNLELLKNNFDNKKDVNSDDFKDFLFESINKLNTYQSESSKLGQMLAVGEIDNIHDVMISSQKAEIALQFAISVKNKVMDAYKEIMRMQV